MTPIQENVQKILEHLKERKGWRMRDVAEQAFFLSVDERERFYRWMMRAKTGKITERHGASAVHERALRWLIHAEESLFEHVPDLSKFDLIEEVGELAAPYSKLDTDQRKEFARRIRQLIQEMSHWRKEEPSIPAPLSPPQKAEKFADEEEEPAKMEEATNTERSPTRLASLLRNRPLNEARSADHESPLSCGQKKIRDDIISHMHFYGGPEEIKAAKKSIEKEVLDNIEAKATWAEIKAIAKRVESQYPNVCSFASHGIHEEEEAKSPPWPEPRTSSTKFRDLIAKKMVVIEEHEAVRKRVAEEAEKIQAEEFDKQTLDKFAAAIAQKMASEFPRKVIHLKEFNH